MNGYPLKLTGIVFERSMAANQADNENSDNALVIQTLDGRVMSFKTLVERYQREAFLFARGMVGNSDDAYDLSQEAFIRAFKNLNRFNPIYQFKTWFFKILSNLCKNHLRQRKSRGQVVTASRMTEIAAAPAKVRPDIIFERTETQKAIWEAIYDLPEKFKEIIVLNHFQDMSYDQLASVLEIPRGSVMSRLYYARLKLREILEKKGIEL